MTFPRVCSKFTWILTPSWFSLPIGQSFAFSPNDSCDFPLFPFSPFYLSYYPCSLSSNPAITKHATNAFNPEIFETFKYFFLQVYSLGEMYR